MSVETRLGQVEDRLGRVENRLEHIDGRLEGIDGRLHGVDGRLDKFEKGQEALGVDLKNEIKTTSEALRTRMDVLHEQLRDDIRALAAPVDQLRREMRAGDATVREDLERRVDPLELVVRDHSADLARLKTRRRR